MADGALADVAPLYGLRLKAPRLELRLGNRDELVALARLAEDGVHPPDEMPFAVAWSDRIGRDDFVDGFVGFHETCLRDWSPDAWTLNLLVWAEGQLVGTQSMSAKRFAVDRDVETGSWLGRRYQRRGYGTEMRAAMLELAFRGLGTQTARSGAVAGNLASLRVAEKLGYRMTGTRTIAPRGKPVAHTDLALERQAWRPPVTVALHGVQPCLGLFGAS